nr:myosin heavy chain-related protein [Tanacetum cinerariifolium]
MVATSEKHEQHVSEQTMNEKTDTITSLQSEVASLEAKGALDANEEIKKAHTRVHELESNKVEETDLKSPDMLVAEDLGQKHIHDFDETAMMEYEEECGIPKSRYENFRHHLEDKVDVNEWGMIRPRSAILVTSGSAMTILPLSSRALSMLLVVAIFLNNM